MGPKSPVVTMHSDTGVRMENTPIVPHGLSYHKIIISILFRDNTYQQHLLNAIINATDRHDSLVPP